MPTVIAGVLKDGVYSRPSPPSLDVLETVVGTTQFTDYTLADAFTYPPPATPAGTITAVFQGSRQITEDFFGMHVQQVANIPAAIAQTPFKVTRSHDSGGLGGMRASTINPSNGVFDWTNSDAWVNAMYAAGKTIIFTLGFGPDWWAASTPNTGKYDNGTTVRASNQPPANIANWDAYCTAVFTRYAGKIKFYELWNECNYTSYWSGTAAQLAVLLRRANQILAGIDANAKIVGPVVQEPETGGTGTAYLNSVLNASDSAAGTGKLWIHYCGIHEYPPKDNFQIHKNQIDNTKGALTAAGIGTMRIINTETGQLEPTYGVSDDVRATRIKRSYLLNAALDVETSVWYSFDNDQMYMRPLMIAAWNEVRNLLLAGPITGCNLLSDGRVCATVGGVNVTY